MLAADHPGQPKPADSPGTNLSGRYTWRLSAALAWRIVLHDPHGHDLRT
jgi:hypothetical protein